MKPKHFINQPQSSVSEFIQGLLLQYPNKLKKLAHHSVLLGAYTSTSSQSVFVLSGGGSGHEPSHAGFISPNMLSGAILGGIFASPSVSSILAAIRTLCIPPVRSNQSFSPKACLLIVKNYTGDRLNFGIACESAQAQGIPCQMILVADDVAIPDNTNGPRGLAGTILVHKVAGAAARRNKTLEQVVSIAQEVASRIKTVGVALDAVTLPGAVTMNTRLEGDDLEMGLGIHGEPGWWKRPHMTVEDMVPILVSKIYQYEDRKSCRPFQKGDELLVMVNNLGGTSNFEMSILAREIVQYLEGKDMGNCRVSRLYVGSFMTSFNMHGISLSILSLNNISPFLLELLDEETDAPGWNAADIWIDHGTGRLSMEEVVEPDISTDPWSELPPQLSTEMSHTISEVIRASCQSLVDAEPLLTQYDAIVGDGDCGRTMQRGASEILSRLDAGTIPTTHPAMTFSSIADAISSSMGGSSGILLEILFRKMSTFLKQSLQESSPLWTRAFEEGIQAMSFYGGASIGSRTMMDAFYPALATLQENSSWTKCAQAATDGANQTAFMTEALAGRSVYVRKEALVGTPDPGAIAVSLVFSSIAKVLEPSQ
jgi:dihydroxyacetone kinase